MRQRIRLNAPRKTGLVATVSARALKVAIRSSLSTWGADACKIGRGEPRSPKAQRRPLAGHGFVFCSCPAREEGSANVIEALLNHVSGHRAGVAGTYNLSTYAAEKKAALDLWASHLMVAIAQATGANVTSLRKA